jgi:hypothetical protein
MAILPMPVATIEIHQAAILESPAAMKHLQVMSQLWASTLVIRILDLHQSVTMALELRNMGPGGMIQIGPTVTRYISLREKLYLTVGGGLIAGFGTSKDIETDEKSKILSLGLGVRPGVALFLNDSFALSAGIGNLFYSFESEKSEESNVNGETPKDTRHNYGLSFSLNTFSVGLRYFLRTAKSE